MNEKIKGDLLRKSTIEKATNVDNNVIDYLVDTLGLEVNGFESVQEISPGVIFIRGITIGGLVHYSVNTIEQFTREKSRSPGAKYGESGTYFAAGNLSGETFEILQSNPEVRKHVVGCRGTFLVINNDKVLEYKAQVDGIHKREPPKLKTSIQNTDLLALTAEDPRFELVDGVVIKNKTNDAAEVVVRDSSIETVVGNIQIQ